MNKIYTSLMTLTMIMVAMTTFTSCEEEDDYIAQQLRDRNWEGYVGAYYNDRWGLSGSEYATVMRFTSRGTYYTSGRGEELDYDTRSPYRDYAYCTFKWFIVDGELTLIYDDDKWTPIYIVDYRLTDTRFWGYIYDGTNRRIQFDFESSDYNDWGNYNRTGSYGGFSNQNYYFARQTTLTDNDSTEATPQRIDRTEQARQLSGEPGAVSIRSGAFATAHMNY